MITQSSFKTYKPILTGSADLYQGSYALYFQSLFSASLPSEFSIPLPTSEQVRNRRRENNSTTWKVSKTGLSPNQTEQDLMLTSVRIQYIPLWCSASCPWPQTDPWLSLLPHKPYTQGCSQPQIMFSTSQENYLSYFKNVKAGGLNTSKHQEVTS